MFYEREYTMPERIVMGYWDCPSCHTKGIRGTDRACPNCGASRTEDVKFYMQKPHDYLSDEEARDKGKGADWMCPYCKTYNSVTAAKCKNCGAAAAESEDDYFSIKEKQAAREAKRRALQNSAPSFPLRRLFFVFALLAIMAGLFFVFSEKDRQIVVTDVSWDIAIEKYRQVSDEGWELPREAELIRKAKEIHHYDQVFDHYETRTRSYTVQVPDGTHTEYSYTDNGDGTYTEHSREVQDYRSETRTEDYQEPVYRNVPIYRIKYYYKEWRWVHERDVATSGHNKNPYFGEANLKKNEREKSRSEAYAFEGSLKGKKKKTTYEVPDRATWDRIYPDHTITVRMQSGKILEYLSFGD